MTKGRRTSVVILITLAELAWLAAFGLLFAYRGKVGELGRMRQELKGTSYRLAQWEKKLPETADLFKRVELADKEKERLRADLKAFEKHLAGTSPEEAARRLAAAEGVEKRLADEEEKGRVLRSALEEKEKAHAGAAAALRKAEDELAKVRERIAALPPNVDELGEQFRSATNRLAEVETKLRRAQEDNRQVLADARHREVGEFSVRRELTGLPDGDLRRVIFLVDTSSSMRSSPAWESAKKLVRTWLEFLPVEECAVVSFNDKAVGFPKESYHRVRQPDGTGLREQRDALLKIFDEVGGGTYTDLLRGLQLAYKYPQPDVMVLFTDGHPRVATKSDAVLAREIFAEVGKHRGVPILTVAVGTYETEGADGPRPKTNAPVAFLKELARRSGGNFLGR
jgi:Mg-chelatase subunit ChlD